jgi:hypothetical protein
MVAHSFQIILEAEIEGSKRENYLRIKKENPAKPIVVFPQSPMILEELANSRSFIGKISFAKESGDPDGDPIIETVVNIKKVLLFNKLNKNSPDYPENLEYYLFGTNSDWHLSHFLSKAPNFEQELDITILDNFPNTAESTIIKISIPSVNEKSKQHIKVDPLTQNDYNIQTENEGKHPISITNRFWINNDFLNH